MCATHRAECATSSMTALTPPPSPVLYSPSSVLHILCLTDGRQQVAAVGSAATIVINFNNNHY